MKGDKFKDLIEVLEQADIVCNVSKKTTDWCWWNAGDYWFEAEIHEYEPDDYHDDTEQIDAYIHLEGVDAETLVELTAYFVGRSE